MPGRALRLLAAALAGPAAVLATLAGAAAPAGAADGAAITHVEVADRELRLLVSVPAGAEVDLEGVEVTVEGVTTAAEAERAGTTGEVRRVAVLAVDTSASMRGARFAAAREAARAFLEAAPADVEVGIVAFADDVVPALAPTTDRAEAAAVVDSLRLSRRTRLYDGVLAALDMAGGDGQHTLLVLSDGADTSATRLDRVIAAVRRSDALVDVVALDQRGPARAALERLADAGRGRVVAADPDALTTAFSAEAAVLARQVQVTAPIPHEVGAAEAPVRVSLPSGSGTLVAEAFARLGEVEPAAAPTPVSERGLVLGSPWLWVGLVALAAGAVAMAALLAPRPARELTPAERATAYAARAGRGPSAGRPRFEPDQALGQAREAAGRVLSRNRSLEARIAHRLEGAGNPLRPAEWLLLHTAILVASGLLGLLLGSGSALVVVLFLALGAFGPYLWLSISRARRRKAFAAALPETLQLMSGSLAAGLSLAQSADTIVREGVEPVASEFRRVLVEARLGVSLEDALEGVAHRFDSQDFAWVVMAIRIQRQVGGNLAELLETVAATMREREYMRRQVNALSAEGKLSAWVLGALPPAFLGYLLLTSREYVSVMFTDPRGWVMLGGAAILLGLGVFWMSRLVKVEV